MFSRKPATGLDGDAVLTESGAHAVAEHVQPDEGCDGDHAEEDRDDGNDWGSFLLSRPALATETASTP